DYNGDRHKAKTTATSRQRFMGTKNPHRYNRRERFRNDKTHSRLRWLQGAVERARAFWKNQYAVPGLQDANQSLNGATIDALLIHGNHIELWQNPAQQRHVEKRSPGQKINRPIARGAGEWRIEITLVIHRKNHRAA